MRIAVISDIHGNMDALNAVIKDMDKQKCEKVFVLGDYAMAGPEPMETVGFFIMKSRDSKYSMIQGNTDLMIADYSSDLYESMKSKAPLMVEALRNDVKILSNSEKAFLKNLPVQLEIEEEGVKFLLVHGSPRRNNEDILPNTPMEEVQAMLKNVDADVILCGHTHIPCGFQTPDKKTVVNAGSVGRPFTPDAKSCYLIVDAWKGRCVFEHRFIEYDKERAADKIRRRDFKGAYELAGMLIDPKTRHM
ncbi:metallophosphoesterase family protein [bacterium]|nr:metallophosphoesterase family protein [bacterium]